MVKDKCGEGGQTAVGLDPINEGGQPDVLQRGRPVMTRRRFFYMQNEVGNVSDAVVRELRLLVCLLLRDGLTVLSMWSESMSGSCM